MIASVVVYSKPGRNEYGEEVMILSGGEIYERPVRHNFAVYRWDVKFKMKKNYRLHKRKIIKKGLQRYTILYLRHAIGSRKTFIDFDTLDQAQRYLRDNAGKLFGVIDL